MKKPDSYLPGIIISLLLAGWLAFLALTAVSNDEMGWGTIGLVLGALYIGGPLAILLLCMWIWYMVRARGQLPGRIHAWLLLPTLFAVLIVPLDELIREKKRERFDEAHPPVRETHINLSGQDLGLDAGRGTDGKPIKAGAQRFVSMTRYPDAASIAAGAFPYVGTRLRDDITSYRYQPVSGLNPPVPADATRPLRRQPDPDVPALLAVGGADAAELVYLYFHYPGHVAFAPAIALRSMTQIIRLKNNRQDTRALVLFRAYNYLSSPVARLEVNGQTLDLGEFALSHTPPWPAPCRDFSRPTGAALIDLQPPLTLRWQTLDEPLRWRTALVDVPDFPQPLASTESAVPLRVLLYLLPDDSVVAERYLEVRLPDEKLAVRATGLPEQARPYASCGGAWSSYDPERVQLLSAETEEKSVLPPLPPPAMPPRP
ncbi:hypothetical protein FJU30_22170 [Affinibrenneria salicis]|uniref:Uncharacterized protein n=1 Tax=Affinibrenneria salicis TaxID=2590031 RepID=A0A5J5FTV8_9GAMM|nr:YIP1 family protein [Affinibrenneria salicis]KAA8996076.1 hypothetical protein FJU30_22170 [Affinibrenneria salicis]